MKIEVQRDGDTLRSVETGAIIVRAKPSRFGFSWLSAVTNRGSRRYDFLTSEAALDAAAKSMNLKITG